MGFLEQKLQKWLFTHFNLKNVLTKQHMLSDFKVGYSKFKK